MKPAKPSRLLRAWMGRYAQGRIRQSFAALSIRGHVRLSRVAQQQPCLVVSNHVSWWDPMLAIYLSARLAHFDGYAMMTAAGLRRFAFLGRLGGFGVDIDDPTDSALAVRYAARLLGAPGRAVWVFPQGGERPSHLRPLGFRPGAAVIARLAPRAAVIPAALRYEVREVPEPYAYLSFGAPLAPVTAGASRKDLQTLCDLQEHAVAAELDTIARHIETPRDDDGFCTVLRHPPASPLARFAEWLLGALCRY